MEYTIMIISNSMRLCCYRHDGVDHTAQTVSEDLGSNIQYAPSTYYIWD